MNFWSDYIKSVLKNPFPYRISSHFLPHLIVVAAILAYALIQIQHFTPAHPEYDCDGYLFLAKRIARFQPLAADDPDPFRHQLHFWVETPNGGIMPKYSPGYPFLMAVAYWFGGDEAMCLVSPIAGTLTLIGAFLLFQLWMQPFMAALAVWVLAINPMWLAYPGYLLTHGVNTCAITWGMYFLWKWVSSGVNKFGILAGLILGFSATVRPTSVLMAVVIGIAVIKRFRDNYRNQGINQGLTRNPVVRSIGILVLSYLAFALVIISFNWTHFGHPIRTGYGLSQEQAAFKLEILWKNFGRVLAGLNETCLYLIFPIGLVGLFTMGTISERLMRVGWFLPTFLIYSAYYWQASGMPFLRFLICTFPVLIGSGFMVLTRTLNLNSPDERLRQRIVKYIPISLFTALIVFLQYGPSQAQMDRMVSSGKSEKRLAAGRMLAQNFGDHVVIFSQSPYEAYLDTVQNFRYYNLARFSGAWGGGERRHSLRTKKINAFYTAFDQEQRNQKQKEIIRSFLSENRPVVFLIPKKSLEDHETRLGSHFMFSLFQDWENGNWGVYLVRFNTKI
ncbi:TPA: hypothetical protein EYO57_01460 [Candidatus Poribacteria bacterium]|nr:hypothetical protein [Candidatus Poribacteria bacterium]